MTNILQNTSADKRQGLYNTQVNNFNRFIKERQEYINLLNSYRAGSRGEGNGYTPENKARIDQLFKRFGTDDTSRLQSQIDGATKQLQEYQKVAKDFLKPAEAVIDTKQAAQNIKTLTAQLKELEKQRKDAVRKGDQEQIDALTKQINQTKTNIGYLDPKAFSTSKTKAAEKPPKDSIADLNNQIKTLRDAQNNVTNVAGWQGFQTQIDEVTNRVKELKGELSNIDAGNMVSLGKIKGVSITDTVTVPTAADMIKRGDQRIKDFKIQDKPTKQETKLADIMGQMNGGISSMVSGIEGLGIELPKGMKDMLGSIQTVTSILTGISTILTAIETISAADAIIPFANGGVVKAAGGYRVPGRTFSGDMVPARLNAGETVLNQAQAGVIANALQDRDFSGGSSMVQPYVDGEHIFLGMNNTSKRMGRGEIVTTSTLRRFGLI